MRVLKLKLMTQTELVKIETEVATFGEFKELEEVKNLGIDWTSTKLMNKSDHATYEVESAKLPAGDSIMFVVPTKSKSGMTNTEIDNLSYNEARNKIREIEELKVNFTGATADYLRGKLKEYYASKETCDCNEPKVTVVINGIKKENVEIVDAGFVITDNEELSVDLVEDLDIVDYITGDELDDEAEELLGELNK